MFVGCCNGCWHSGGPVAFSSGGWFEKSCSAACSVLGSPEGRECTAVYTASTEVSQLPSFNHLSCQMHTAALHCAQKYGGPSVLL